MSKPCHPHLLLDIHDWYEQSDQEFDNHRDDDPSFKIAGKLSQNLAKMYWLEQPAVKRLENLQPNPVVLTFFLTYLINLSNQIKNWTRDNNKRFTK